MLRKKEKRASVRGQHKKKTFSELGKTRVWKTRSYFNYFSKQFSNEIKLALSLPVRPNSEVSGDPPPPTNKKTF